MSTNLQCAMKGEIGGRDIEELSCNYWGRIVPRTALQGCVATFRFSALSSRSASWKVCCTGQGEVRCAQKNGLCHAVFRWSSKVAAGLELVMAVSQNRTRRFLKLIHGPRFKLCRPIYLRTATSKSLTVFPDPLRPDCGK